MNTINICSNLFFFLLFDFSDSENARWGGGGGKSEVSSVDTSFISSPEKGFLGDKRIYPIEIEL